MFERHVKFLCVVLGFNEVLLEYRVPLAPFTNEPLPLVNSLTFVKFRETPERAQTYIKILSWLSRESERALPMGKWASTHILAFHPSFKNDALSVIYVLGPTSNIKLSLFSLPTPGVKIYSAPLEQSFFHSRNCLIKVWEYILLVVKRIRDESHKKVMCDPRTVLNKNLNVPFASLSECGGSSTRTLKFN